MAFKIRSKMVEEIPENFKNKYKEEGLICQYCTETKIMSQSHCMECSAWVDQRKGLDLMNIMDLVTFFRRLLAERTRLEAESVRKTSSHDSK